MAADVAERTALQQAIRDMLSDLASEERIRQTVATERRFDGDLWAQLIQMGVLELATAEQREASGGSYADLAVVFEELGRALAPVPALTTVAVSTVLDLSGSEAGAPWLSELLAGRVRAALVMTGDGSTWGRPTPVRAQRSGEYWTVTGTVGSVSDGAGADAFVVLAETSDGPAFFLVVGASPAVSVVTRDALDLTRPLVDLTFTDASATMLCAVADTPGVARRVLDVCAVLLAAEQVGLAQRALDTAVEYAKVRVQFDRPIGSFQAIKHSCVDMLMLVEGARCLVSSAAAGLDDDDPTEAAVRAGIAAAYAAEAAVECGERCLQIHGGIGFTWEHVTHLLLRKAKSDAVRFGRPWEHWERVTDRLAALAAANGTAGH